MVADYVCRWPKGGLFMTPWRLGGSKAARPVAIRPAYQDASDAELITWSAEGDRRAFDEVVVRHGPFALRVAARLVSNSAVAEDLVQEAMVKAWNQAGRFDAKKAKLTTWLYRIVVNQCIDHRRKSAPDQLPEGFDSPDPARSAHQVVEETERTAAVARAVGELPARHRAAVTLVYDEGLSGAETARVMGLSAKAVERILARALKTLRTRLVVEEVR